jgi:16S rRNA (guanine966-N2)-methyltransferase
MDANQALRQFAAEGQSFDYLFLDPPYAKQEIVQQVESMLIDGLIRPFAYVVCETDKSIVLPEQIGSLHLVRAQTYGISAVTIYRNEG